MPSNTETAANAVQYYGHARPEVQALVPAEAERILDIGCGAGALGAALKQRQACQVWGVEFVPSVAEQAQTHLDRVIAGSIEDAELLDALPKDYFDVIVLADVLEHLREPEEVLKRLKACLWAGSTVVASVPNVRHWSVVKDLLEGRWNYQEAGILDRTHLRFFTGSSLVTLFQDAGYEIGEAQAVRLTDTDTMPEGLAATLANFGLDTGTLVQESEVYQFLLVARPAVPQSMAAPAVEATTAAEATTEKVVGQATPVVPGPAGDLDPDANLLPFPSSEPVASLVMLTLNQLEFTRICVDSIFAHTKTSFELIVVDNGSTDGTLEYLEALVGAGKPVKVIANPANLGFGAGNNQGIAVARGEYIVLINNDLVLTEGWLERMIGHAERQEGVGIVGPRSNCVSGPQLIPNLELSDLSQIDDEAARVAAEEAGTGFDFNRVVGFCMVIKRAVIDAIGGFDERFGLGNFEDDDLCWRALIAGFRCFVANDTYVHHFGSRTFAGEQIDYKQCMETAWGRFKEKWMLDSELQLDSSYAIVQHPFQAELHRSELPNAAIVPIGSPEDTPPARAERYNSWGERMYSCGKLAEARAFFQKAVSVSETCANALNNLGVVSVDENEVEAAAGFLERSIENDQENLNTLWNLIALYVHLGKDQEAVPLLQNFLRLDPGNQDAESLLDELAALTATDMAVLP